MGVALVPDEADPPPLIDADAVLTGPISRELLQVVSWRDAKIGQALGVIEHTELAIRELLDVGRETRGSFSGEYAGRLAVPHRLDHDAEYITLGAKRQTPN